MRYITGMQNSATTQTFQFLSPTEKAKLSRFYTQGQLCPVCVQVDDPADCEKCAGSRVI